MWIIIIITFSFISIFLCVTERELCQSYRYIVWGWRKHITDINFEDEKLLKKGKRKRKTSENSSLIHFRPCSTPWKFSLELTLKKGRFAKSQKNQWDAGLKNAYEVAHRRLSEWAKLNVSMITICWSRADIIRVIVTASWIYIYIYTYAA